MAKPICDLANCGNERRRGDFYCTNHSSPCLVDPCDFGDYVRGLCRSHYARLLKYGDPFFSRPRGRPDCSSPIRSGPRKGQPAVGTFAGYQRHWRRGEKPCAECAGHWRNNQPPDWYKYQPRPKVERVCDHCGVGYQTIDHPDYKYCSTRCGELARGAVPLANRTCRQCSSTFDARGGSQWVCPDCKSAPPPYRVPRVVSGRGSLGRRLVADIINRYSDEKALCEWCRTPTGSRLRKYCSEEHLRLGLGHRPTAIAVYIRECEGCGELRVGRTPHWRFCSKACRRVRPVTALTRQRIYDRDGWACQICGEATDPSDFDVVMGSDGREATVVGPLHPSLDHIIPKSLGGPDTMENLRTAHHGCNSERGTGADQEQLAWAI